MSSTSQSLKKNRTVWAFGIALFVMTVIGLSSIIYMIRRSTFPFFPTVDQISSEGVVHVNSVNGSPKLQSVAQKAEEKIQEGSVLRLGDRIELENDSNLRLNSASGWEVALDGDGEFVLEDARRKDDLSVRTLLWFINQGAFRARYMPEKSPQTKEAWLQLRFPGGRIVTQGGEILVRIPRAGGGRLRVVQGAVEVFWDDGRRAEVEANEMEYL